MPLPPLMALPGRGMVAPIGLHFVRLLLRLRVIGVAITTHLVAQGLRRETHTLRPGTKIHMQRPVILVN